LAWTAAALGCSASHLTTDGGATSDGGPPIGALDAGPPAVAPDAAPPRLDGGPGPVEGIACGEGVCAVGAEGCLATCRGDAGAAPACLPRDPGQLYWSAECPSGEHDFPVFWLTCDGPEDCPGTERCSVTHGSAGDYVHCQCDDDAGCDLVYASVLCHADADCPPVAPRCVPGELRGYAVCRP
jgi:hypothetical protein